MKLKHTPWKQTALPIESALPAEALCSSLHEAYKKHSAELASLEDRHNKSLLLILGIFGAGATAVSTVSIQQEALAAWCFTVIVASVAWVGVHATHEAHDLRKAVRDLLVRCELAMQFYTPGVFVKGKRLYDDAELGYPDKGATLTIPGYVAIITTAVLLIFLIWHNYSNGLPKKTLG
jgi:small-conductance mechanosensitive channel